MPKHFDVKPETIKKVFIEPKHFFEIPRFQRPYSWEEGNIEEFWETIFKSAEPVFLGTIILNIDRLDTEDVVEIIDGQQRYLTIHVLGAVVRDTCRELQKEFDDTDFDSLARGVTQSIIGKPDKWDNSKFDNYLTPGDSIKPFFRDYIQSFDGPSRIDSELKVKKKSEEERVKEAYLKFKELLHEQLAPLTSDEKKVLLKELIDKRLAKHLFARIEIDDEDLAYEIFETVNAKGVDLNVADLLKNQIFKHVMNGDARFNDSAKERWQSVLDNVDAANLTMKDFLSYFWSSKYGYVADRKLYRTIRDHFKEDARWSGFLDELVENSRHIRNIFAGSTDDLEAFCGDMDEASKMFESLRVLRSTKAKTWAILYLCLFRNLYADRGDEKKFVMANRWDIVARFTFVYYEILNLGGNWYFKEIWNFCKKIEDYTEKKRSPKDFADLFQKELFTKLDSKLPKLKDSFAEGFVSISYKETKKARIIIRYVLSELEKHLAGKFDTGFNEALVSIEHFLPQDPKEWGRAKKDVKDHVNRIGNLLLISKRKNGALGNKDLASKASELADQSKMKLVEDLLAKSESGEWDFGAITSANEYSSIENRGAYLAELGYKIWVEDLRRRMGFG